MNHDDSNYIDKFEVGSFISEGDRMHVYVYGKNYDSVPYMNIFNENKSIDTNICILESSYYQSNNKLTPQQLIDFEKFMLSEDKEEPIKGCDCKWREAVFLWNAADDNNIKINKHTAVKPSYSELR